MIRVKASAFIGSFLLIVIGLIYAVSAGNDIMTVEADILSGGSVINDTIIRVEVPDYIYFGNVTIGQMSDELTIYVNNTGNVDITVTPRLTNSSEELFSYLYLRKFKTSNGSAVPFTRIGDFSLDISKPSSGATYKSAYFYITLDLRNYTGSLNRNLIGHRANVKFFAVEN